MCQFSVKEGNLFYNCNYCCKIHAQCNKYIIYTKKVNSHCLSMYEFTVVDLGCVWHVGTDVVGSGIQTKGIVRGGEQRKLGLCTKYNTKQYI